MTGRQLVAKHCILWLLLNHTILNTNGYTYRVNKLFHFIFIQNVISILSHNYSFSEPNIVVKNVDSADCCCHLLAYITSPCLSFHILTIEEMVIPTLGVGKISY